MYVLSNGRVVEADGFRLEAMESGSVSRSTAPRYANDQNNHPTPTSDDAIRLLIGMPIDEVEKRLIIATLAHCGGNKSKAARQLQIGLKTLYRKLDSYGLKEVGDETVEEAQST
jgi:DNA-binding NtrC family response regulator